MKAARFVALGALSLLPCLANAVTTRADPNQLRPDGSTPLAWAVENQDVDAVRQLLKQGARVSGAGDPSVSPLIIACQYGDPAILEMLLNAGADVKVARDDGITALSVCAGTAPTSIVTRMIAAGAEVEKADANGQTPVMWAAAKGSIDNIKLLVSHGAQINRATVGGFTPLFFALKSGNPQAPLAVLEVGGNADYVAPDGTSAVQLAMYQRDYAFAARMIERGASLTAFDRNGNQLLHAAVLAGQPSLVKQLLAKGANPNALSGRSKVQWRFEVNFKTADYDPPPKPPLMLAAESGLADVMQALVEGGADPEFRMPDGTNVVLAAASSSKLAALELALRLQPDANVTESNGMTPLHLLVAAGVGNELAPMMKLLADKGARLDLKNRAGKTPADMAKDAETDARTAFTATFEKRTASTL